MDGHLLQEDRDIKYFRAGTRPKWQVVILWGCVIVLFLNFLALLASALFY